MRIEVKTHGERMIVDAHMIRCVTIWDEHGRMFQRFFLGHGGREICFDLFAVNEKAEDIRFSAEDFIFDLIGRHGDDCYIGSLGGLFVENRDGTKSQHFGGEFRIVFRGKKRYLTKDEAEYQRELKRTDQLRKNRDG